MQEVGLETVPQYRRPRYERWLVPDQVELREGHPHHCEVATAGTGFAPEVDHVVLGGHHALWITHDVRAQWRLACDHLGCQFSAVRTMLSYSDVSLCPLEPNGIIPTIALPTACASFVGGPQMYLGPFPLSIGYMYPFG